MSSFCEVYFQFLYFLISSLLSLYGAIDQLCWFLTNKKLVGGFVLGVVCFVLNMFCMKFKYLLPLLMILILQIGLSSYYCWCSTAECLLVSGDKFYLFNTIPYFNEAKEVKLFMENNEMREKKSNSYLRIFSLCVSGKESN